MAETKAGAVPLNDLTTEQPDSTDSDYLAWKRRKIEASLRHAREHPEAALTHDAVFDKLRAKFRS